MLYGQDYAPNSLKAFDKSQYQSTISLMDIIDSPRLKKILFTEHYCCQSVRTTVRNHFSGAHFLRVSTLPILTYT